MNGEEFKEALTILSIELEFLRGQIRMKDTEILELKSELQMMIRAPRKKITFWQWLTS